MNLAVFVVMKALKETEHNLFENMIGVLDVVVDEFIKNKSLGKCFINVKQSRKIFVISHEDLLGRVVYVPKDDNSGYVSLVLNSYQHN